MGRFAVILAAGVSALALTSAAKAADLIIEQPYIAPVVVEDSGDWEGAFVGVFAGYAWGEFFFDPEPAEYTLDLSGWLVGVDAGYNIYLGNSIVGGIVGDIAWSDIGGNDDESAFNIDWLGSLRGRLGFDGGAFMPYLTAGLAVANGTWTLGGSTDSATHIGWTVGAGVEIAATEDLSIDLLYRYSDYGAQSYDVDDGPYDMGLTTHQVQAGLHWNF